MAKPLTRYVAGVRVRLTCYKEGCNQVFTGLLKREYELFPGFLGEGKFRWQKGTPVKSFTLFEDIRCPQCKALLTSVIIVSQGPCKKPIIFGYDSEPL